MNINYKDTFCSHDYCVDNAIENARSFAEAKSIMKQRLVHLRVDLQSHSQAEETLLASICSAQEDRKKALMDLYAGFYSPCKVTDTTYLPKAQGDMNDVFLDFSEGFDLFVKAMEENYVEMILRRRRASILLNKVLSFSYPYSRILYLYYYKNEDPIAIAAKLYISRATFYRMKSSAIESLTSMYYKPQGNTEETAS